jgi:hypothetical protein
MLDPNSRSVLLGLAGDGYLKALIRELCSEGFAPLGCNDFSDLS